MRAIVLLALLLAGCAGDPPTASKGLNPPAAWMMVKCQPLPAVPERDGDPTVRREHTIKTRTLYVECSNRQAGLAAYAKNVSTKK